MADFKRWLDEMQPKVWPEGKLDKAINYCLRRWEKLCRFLDHGEMDPDTNAVERLIRSFVIGRVNWVLHKSQAGGHCERQSVFSRSDLSGQRRRPVPVSQPSLHALPQCTHCGSLRGTLALERQARAGA
jgi:hypothetical protein